MEFSGEAENGGLYTVLPDPYPKTNRQHSYSMMELVPHNIDKPQGFNLFPLSYFKLFSLLTS